MFFLLLTKLLTTLGSAKVVVSPSWSCWFAAIFLKILLIIFPDLVLGSPGEKCIRSGVATCAAESGADERSIMAMTGHKTTQMVRRYIRDANLFKNNALNKIKILFYLSD